ncbi:50S ribosomal protein L9 [Theileria orientalis strain Shintoku]|uniref:50S ribosomal protein L9 n=1 Tax=Theileria orientalis strain Shintoku TaxID=869250 RepID=J4C381_THEOR|nr:50S ribosomal protein L9 [Theileria orientalis strain Shintoku]BAM39981.1 50S ribosomal protein L9 [Theileria orientalis strain Shintoku]|eukprot:XP_009690282.1 50S ribosomal protein L9 [Theileria orientalis strain Shintoku]
MIKNYNHIYIFKRFKILPTRGTISRRTWYPRVDTKKISVILLRDSERLGKTGDIVETSRGYANYHLIPKGVACYANWYNIDQYCKESSEFVQSRKAYIDSQFPDLKLKPDESQSILDSRPENILFSGQLAGYALTLNVNTFSSDRNRLTSPVSLYNVLDEFSKKHNIDILPYQIVEVRKRGSDSPLCPFGDYEYVKFTEAGEYVFLVKFPLVEDPENEFKFTLELVPLQLKYLLLFPVITATLAIT